MDGHFDECLRRLKLTNVQIQDARTKIKGVAKKLHEKYYDSEYTGSSKLIIGSHGKKTVISPPGDVDLLFKIPLEAYERFDDYKSNGQSALLQEIREVLSDKYTTTEVVKAWGKVVLVEFSEGAHNVELLPGFELDGVFMIPNSENGGSWESFDVRSEMNAIRESNDRTDGRTRELIKLVKCWRLQNAGLELKSFQIEEYVVSFFDNVANLEVATSAELVTEFFEWLAETVNTDESYAQTARTRSQKALSYEANEQYIEACKEWRKILGEKNFPVYSSLRERVHQLRGDYPSSEEEYIEDIHRISLDHNTKLRINSEVHPNREGFQNIRWGISKFLAKHPALPPNARLYFRAETNQDDVEFMWKIRNFGDHARNKGQLRGGIKKGSPDGTWEESTEYHGIHYVECYAIRNGECVAIARREIPINTRMENENQ